MKPLCLLVLLGTGVLIQAQGGGPSPPAWLEAGSGVVIPREVAFENPTGRLGAPGPAGLNPRG